VSCILKGERGAIPHGTVNEQARPEKVGAVAHAQQSGAGKLVKVAVGGNSTGKEGRPTSHVNCK
jgi:hypothetical protein